MKKNEHLRNQVLYITNPAYDVLQSENLLESKEKERLREQMTQTEIED
ncbi:hypothetical protein [Bacillus sp. REN16]|nr:hypothetical protein [Bacillus sp. REN16]MCC3357298.1 hypothetical protein [Bacillus sp. REN16]